MYTCTVNEINFKYSNDIMDMVVERLHQKMLDTFGLHKVINTKNDAVYRSCKQISSPGIYIIHSKNENIDMSCMISQD